MTMMVGEVLVALVVAVAVAVVAVEEMLLVVLGFGCYFVVVVRPMMVGYFVVAFLELADCFVVGVVLSLVPSFEDR